MLQDQVATKTATPPKRPPEFSADLVSNACFGRLFVSNFSAFWCDGLQV
jgi:hypothetical protein